MQILFIYLQKAVSVRRLWRQRKINGLYQIKNFGRKVKKKWRWSNIFSFCDSNRFRRFFYNNFFLYNYYFLSVILKLFTRATTYWKNLFYVYFLKFLFRKKSNYFYVFLTNLCVCVGWIKIYFVEIISR